LSEHITSDEPYLLVEEVAERLGLPLSVLMHRVEAGDIPARRVERADGLHYALRLGDLGIELDDRGLRSAAMQDDGQEKEVVVDDDEETLTAAFEPTEPSVESAIFSAFDSGPAPLPGMPKSDVDVSGQAVEDGDEELPAVEEQEGPGPSAVEWASEDGDARPWRAATEPSPPWSPRPREPQQPPVWLNQEPVNRREENEVEDDADADADEDDSAVAELAVPPPTREPAVSLVDSAPSGPRGDLASMSLDARELVAGLLDRWERTLEQRIYTEQRQRFQAELVARQNMVKQLQMELHTARAEHAAAQAEKDRVLAGKERELADRERDLTESRRIAEQAERSATPPAARRRRWFRGRDD
jgi:hypothetical protein